MERLSRDKESKIDKISALPSSEMGAVFFSPKISPTVTPSAAATLDTRSIDGELLSHLFIVPFPKPHSFSKENKDFPVKEHNSLILSTKKSPLENN